GISIGSDALVADAGRPNDTAQPSAGADRHGLAGNGNTPSGSSNVAVEAPELEDAVATLPPDVNTAVATLDLGTTDASDGALNLSARRVINLGNAASGDTCDCDGNLVLNEPCRWNCDAQNNPADLTNGVGGRGVYDAEKWAIVFKYSSVNVSAGTLNFQN